jgi:GNAT superfamily N-acetyltransferase
VQIDLLADRPADIDVLVGPMVDFWRRVPSDDTIGARRERLRAHLNTNCLPIAWVAHDGEVVLGTAALRTTDLPGFDHLTPWLSGVFVFPEYQRRGIGTSLCRHVETFAETMGHRTLYLFTLDQQVLYRRLGWRYLQKGTWMGIEADVMTKSLA